ncbi:DUF3426 domain-containing protein [Marinobacter daepoensis]|uniref:DUF3426 domain-containing protein n=1 Tax=Marinobacter daepoensis TaxID=262077 RepID=UPI001C9418BD|nr:DUF3426 domain-containing protein [Marinobacter daepoensis]MBY6033903.1 DUF3426 domain-containing protein [Marinobacter daepoensis]
MTQSSLQTQCPNCETRFRVSDEQLSVARGKVRCGNCMKIFNAVEHQVTSGKDQNAGPSATADTPQPTPPHRFEDEEELIFADNPEEDASEGRYAGTRLTFSDDELSDSFRNFDEPEDSRYGEEELATEKHGVDESWAEAMLNDDEPDTPASPETPEAGLTATPGQDAAPSPETESLVAPASGLTDANSPLADEDAPPKPEPEPEPEPAVADDLSLADDDRVGDPIASRTRKDSPPDNLYHDLRRDPVSVGNGRSRLRTALWTLTVLALLGVLVAQVTWYQFDRLSAIPQLRPLYAKACEFAGCELKPLVNVEAIQSRKLVVRTDPANRDQLIVDAVILNRAGFEQPFPAIALTFSNLNGDVVAQSTFTPEEYLAGDAASLKAMPVETPVRIAIQIRDPGRDAVNYNLSFRPWLP